MAFSDSQTFAEVPTRLDQLLGFSVRCPCGKTHSVELKQASIRSGAVEDIVPFVADVGRQQSIVVVADRITRDVAGDRVVSLLDRANASTRCCIVPDGAGGRPHADDPTLALVQKALENADLAIAAGAGTINDLTKLASFNRGIPYITVATAPSMNGYTSAIAAIMRQGVKRTVPCHQPVGLIADLDILCRAPKELIGAGLGDLESKPTSTADFRLAGMLRGAYYCPAPEKVVFEAEQRAAAAAAGLARGDAASIAALTEALVLSGISMKLAGSSGPASGGEHLMSHYWDMTAEAEGRLEGIHGAQVGVTTIVAAQLYEQLQQIDPEKIDVQQVLDRQPNEAELEQYLKKYHGQHYKEVAEEFRAKRLPNAALAIQLERIKTEWQAIWRQLKSSLRPAATIRQTLTAAGAPTTVSALGLTPQHLQTTFVVAREIRNRYTALDLAAELGLLDAVAPSVLRASGCLA